MRSTGDSCGRRSGLFLDPRCDIAPKLPIVFCPRVRRLAFATVALIGLLLPPAQASPVRNPDNSHYYDAILVTSGISWEAARTAAANKTYRSMQGHLATVTSSAENDFIKYQFPVAEVNAFWLGGFQQPGILDPAAGWQWITGEPWGYTNWNQENATEPNDAWGLGTGSQDENKLQFWYTAGGRWNDSRNRDTQNPSYGYVVEYEPDTSPDPPAISGYFSPQTRTDAVVSAPPGSMLLITGTNLGRTGTVLFSGIPIPAAVARWSPTEVLLWVPTAPSYPFATKATTIDNGKQVEGGDFTIAAPEASLDNLLANGSFEYPDSSTSPVDFGFTYGPDWRADTRSFRGYAIPGWRISAGTIDVKKIYWENALGQGQQSIDLVGSPGAATIHQTFFTEKGRRYVFSCWLAHNYFIPDSRAAIYLNGAFFAILTHSGPASPDNMNWTRVSGSFNAPAAQTTLTIQDLSGYSEVQGTALDGLRVTLAAN
jgi:uncharacterized protein DUF642/lectin-like protein